MVKLEILVDDRTAADIEAIETCFCQWEKAKNKGDEAAANKALSLAGKHAQANEMAILIHTVRPPSLFIKDQNNADLV
jgi:hypothetical protein